jgi:hypothetical protein
MGGGGFKLSSIAGPYLSLSTKADGAAILIVSSIESSGVINTRKLAFFGSFQAGFLIIGDGFPVSRIGPVVLKIDPQLTQATGESQTVSIQPEINQSGDASAIDLEINRTETSTGTGPQLLLACRVGGSDRLLVASDGSITLRSGAQILTGTGSPEGVVSAPVGSTYQRSDGGSGTSFYVKESGVGNTGWSAK